MCVSVIAHEPIPRRAKGGEGSPCMLMNCPSFNAAPRIWESLETRRLMLASVIITDESSWDPAPLRRRTSDAAPYPSDAASPVELGLRSLLCNKGSFCTSVVEQPPNSRGGYLGRLKVSSHR